MQLCLAPVLYWFLGSKSQGIGSKLTLFWQREGGREGDTPHNITFSLLHGHTQCCLWAQFPVVSLSSWGSSCSIFFSFSHCFFSLFHSHSKLWLEVTRHQAVHPSGPHFNIWRGCSLLWHEGRDTHISHIVQINCICVCVCVFLFAVFVFQSISLKPLFPSLSRLR